MSSFLEAESSFTQSITAESTESHSNNKRKWRAPVWKYCRRPTPDENQEYLYYPYYPPDPPPIDYKGPYNTKSFANMAKHLERNHDIIIEKALSKNQELVN